MSTPSKKQIDISPLTRGVIDHLNASTFSHFGLCFVSICATLSKSLGVMHLNQTARKGVAKNDDRS